MITIYLQGGLGNQLFQIFAYLSFCLDNDEQIIIPKHKHAYHSTSGDSRPTYWDTFLKNLEPYISDDRSLLQLGQYIEPFYHYFPIKKFPDVSYRLIGYFQSYKYFEKNYDKIIKMIKVNSFKNEILQNNLDLFKKKYTVSMHFRIGDYKDFPDYHPILSNDYYINCLNYINSKTNKKIHVMVFYEKKDEKTVFYKIKIYKRKFPNINFNFVDTEQSDWKQMLLMSCCKHNIVANSSFSWWGAYFNDYKDKIVLYPDVYFGKKAVNQDGSLKNTIDLFPSSWIKITNSKLT